MERLLIGGMLTALQGLGKGRMKDIKSVSFQKSPIKGKKFRAVFFDAQHNRITHTDFGASGMSDYTKHKDPERKERYLDRHRKNEDWDDFTTAGSLSRWVLWNLPSLAKSKKDYARRFNLRLFPSN